MFSINLERAARFVLYGRLEECYGMAQITWCWLELGKFTLLECLTTSFVNIIRFYRKFTWWLECNGRNGLGLEKLILIRMR